MYNFYTDMVLRDMRIDAAVDALRDGYQQGKYSYKAGVAYIILDEKWEMCERPEACNNLMFV